MTDWQSKYVDLIKSLWKGYCTYSSNGSTNAQFERHIWPIIRDARKTIRESVQQTGSKLEIATSRTALAKALYEIFEFRTSRDWDLVGEENSYPNMHKEWMELSNELIYKLSPLSDSDSVEPVPVYAIGYSNNGMFYGLTPDLKDCLDHIPPDSNDRPCYIFEFNEDHQILYDWDYQTSSWCKR